MSLPPFNAVILGEQSAILINYVTATPGIPSEIADLAGRLDYYQRNPSAFVPVPIPGGPPDDFKIKTYDPMWGGVRRSGDDGAPFYDPAVVTVIPIPIPSSPTIYANNLLAFGISEYRTPGTLMQASISRTAGDFNPATRLAYQAGSRITPSIRIGVDAQPGETIYVSIRCWSDDWSVQQNMDNIAKMKADLPGGYGLSLGQAWPH